MANRSRNYSVAGRLHRTFSRLLCRVIEKNRLMSRLQFAGEVALVIGNEEISALSAHILRSNGSRCSYICGGAEEIALSLFALDLTERRRSLTIVSCDLSDAAFFIGSLSPEYIVGVAEESETSRFAPSGDDLILEISAVVPAHSTFITPRNSGFERVVSLLRCKKTIVYNQGKIIGDESSTAYGFEAAVLLAGEAGNIAGQAVQIAREYTPPDNFEHICYGAASAATPNYAYLMKRERIPFTADSLGKSLSLLNRVDGEFTAIVAAYDKSAGYGYLCNCDLTPLTRTSKVVVCGDAAHIVALRLKIAGIEHVEIERSISPSLRKKIGRRSYIIILDHEKYNKIRRRLFIAVSRVANVLKKERAACATESSPVPVLPLCADVPLLPASTEAASADTAVNYESDAVRRGRTALLAAVASDKNDKKAA